MPQLSDVLGVGGDAETLPNYTLATAQTIGQVADFEDYLCARDRAVAIMAGEMVPKPQADALEARSEAKAATGFFAYGTPAFRQACAAYSHAHGLLWANLRTHHPHITLREARSLITPANLGRVRLALCAAWGMTLGGNPDPKGSQPLAGEPSSGDPSSTDWSTRTASPSKTSAT